LKLRLLGVFFACGQIQGAELKDGRRKEKLSRTAKQPERMKIQTISKILRVTSERAAQLCEAEVFPSAKKICNAYWTADKNDVLEYMRLTDKECRPETEERVKKERRSAIAERITPFLGKMSDAKVAKLTGVSRQTVARHRKKAGIGAKRVVVKWQDFDDLLGKVPDKEIAERTGCSLTAVCYRRRKFKIPAFDKWKKLDGMLKTMSDAEIAEELGCDPKTAAKRRKLYKIPARMKPESLDEPKSAENATPQRRSPRKKTKMTDADISNYQTLDMLIAMREEENGNLS
jgi:hypothetical protein